MKRRVDTMVPFGLRAQDHPPPPQPPHPPWSPSHHRLLDIGSSSSFVGMDISTPSVPPSSSSSSSSSRLLHHSLMSDFSTSQTSSSSSSFGYSQKNFHISDGTLYSILSPFQSRRSTSRPSFLRGHATITSTTPTPKGGGGGGGGGNPSCRKSKLKFHNQEVPPSYRDRAKKPPLPTNAATGIPPLRTTTHFDVLDTRAGLFDDRPSPPVSLSASSSSVPGAGGCPLGSCSSTSSNSSWFESVFREEDCPTVSSSASRDKYEDDEVVVVDSDGSAMDLSSSSSIGHRGKSFYSRQSSSESESYSLSSMRSFKRDLFTAAASGSTNFPEADEDDDDDDDDTPLNLCLADLRRARPSMTETLSPAAMHHIKRELYFDDEEDTSDDDSDDDDGSFSGGPIPQNNRRFSVPDLLLSDSFLDVRHRFRDSHSPSMDSSVSESSRTLDDQRPSQGTTRAKRHHDTCPPTPPPVPSSKNDSAQEVQQHPTFRSYSQGSVPPDDDDDDGKPCLKSPRISEMLQNMTLLDCRTHLERYAAIRQRLMATHPEMFLAQCPSQHLEDLDSGKTTTVANTCWSDVPLIPTVDFEKQVTEKQPIPIATTRSAESMPPVNPTVPYCPVTVVTTVPVEKEQVSCPATSSSTRSKEQKNDNDQALPFLRTRHRVVSPAGGVSKSTPVGGKSHPVRPRRPPPSPTLSERSSRSPYTNNDISICKFKLIKGSQPVLEEKKSVFVPVPRSSSDRGVYPGGRVNEGASTSTSTSNSSSSLLHQTPSTSGCPPQASGSGISPAADSFRTFKIHVGSQEDMGRKLATGGSKRLRRRSRKALVREKLEATFREQGFLIKTQQVSSAEGAVYCKFRQLRKFTRYLYKSWRDYLPKDLDELNESSGLARNQSF